MSDKQEPVLGGEAGAATCRRARDKGISLIVRSDADEYLDMTLRDIGEEWRVDPLDLLLALDCSRPPCHISDELRRRDDETFSEYIRRLCSNEYAAPDKKRANGEATAAGGDSTYEYFCDCGWSISTSDRLTTCLECGKEVTAA